MQAPQTESAQHFIGISPATTQRRHGSRASTSGSAAGLIAAKLVMLLDANVLLYANDAGDPRNESAVTGNLVTDAALAAIAIEHGIPVVTNDSDFHRFPVTVVNPFA